MQSVRSGLLAAIVLSSSFVSFAVAQETAAAPATQAASADAAFEASIERRAAKTVGEFKLDDAAKAERVKERFKQHYRDVQAFDLAHGKARADAYAALRKDRENAELKAKYDEISAPIMAKQKAFFAEMSAELTPEQVDAIREALVGGRYSHNIRGFKVEYPNLPPAVWAQVEAMWQECRETAMSLGTAGAKDNLFGIYKGRVNNFLSKEGFTGASVEKKKAAAATKPAA